jgi:hypothetical protein
MLLYLKSNLTNKESSNAMLILFKQIMEKLNNFVKD